MKPPIAPPPGFLPAVWSALVRAPLPGGRRPAPVAAKAVRRAALSDAAESKVVPFQPPLSAA